MKLIKTLIVTAGLFGSVLFTQAQTIRVPYYFNNSVSASAQKGDTIFVGGNFTTMGYNDSFVAYGAAVDFTEGKPNTTWAKPNGIVSAVIADGNGGVYIGGDFTVVGTETRRGIAHINASGIVTNLFEGITLNNKILAMALDGNILYIGGAFTSVSDKNNPNITRNRLAAININTGEFTDWDPNANSLINTLVIKGSIVYVGGSFTQIGGNARANFVPVSASTGLAEVWNPVVNGSVNAIAFYGDTLFIGGSFTSFDGVLRNYLAAVNSNDNSVLSWNPDANNRIDAIEVSTDRIYVGGTFTTIGGLPRINIASVDRISGAVNNWNPMSGTASAVNDMALHDNVLYISGTFTGSTRLVGGQIRVRYAALDINIDTLMATSWYPDAADVQPSDMAISGNVLYLGGEFKRMGTLIKRTRLAAFRASTGEILDWAPEASNAINQMAYHKELDRIYIGSSTAAITVNGNPATRIAALDANTGASIVGWNPAPNQDVRVFLPINNQLFIAGSFTAVGDSTRNRIAVIDDAGEVTAWKIVGNVSNFIQAMAYRNDTLYVGGLFLQFNGTTRNRLAAVRVSTQDLLTTWNPNASGDVNSIVLHYDTLYIGGAFTTIGTGTDNARSRLAAVHAITGARLAFNPNSNNTVNRIAINNRGLYAGGSFTTLGGISRPYIAAVDITTGTSPAWTTSITASPTTLLITNNTVYAGVSSNATAGAYLIAIEEEASLPVTFTTVKATKQNEDVKVEWSTASEVNNDYFEVERSSDGKTFEPVSSQIQGAGTSSSVHNYAFTDYSAFSTSTLYYRIKQVDFDGQFAYSKVVSVNQQLATTNQQLSVYPNPFSNSVNVEFVSLREGTANINIVDIAGKDVQLNISKHIVKGNNILTIDTDKLNKGIYFLSVELNGEKQVVKLVKQ